MLFVLLSWILFPVQAHDFFDSGCRPSYSNASFKKIDIRSGMHANQEGEDPNTTTMVMVITDAKSIDDARGKDKIYFQMTLPTSSQNLQNLKALAIQIEKGQISNLCLKSIQDWVELDSSFRLRYAVEPNMYVIDAQQPFPRD